MDSVNNFLTMGRGELLAGCLSLTLLLGPVSSQDVSDLTQSQPDQASQAPVEENIKQIVDIKISEIYLGTPGNIENENVEKLNNESEPDISRLVEVKIPIINLSDAHSSKAVTTQIPDSSVIVPTIPILPVQSPFEPTMPMSNKVTADEENISGLVEVKIPIINLRDTISFILSTEAASVSYLNPEPDPYFNKNM